jgi:hypothetical protein
MSDSVPDELIDLVYQESHLVWDDAAEIVEKICSATKARSVSREEIEKAVDILREDLSSYTYDEKIRIITKIAAVLGMNVEEYS